MKTKLFWTAAAVSLWSVAAPATDYNASNFYAAGRIFQPAPSGHRPGKDNGPGSGLHNAGEDCGLCHREGGKAQRIIFTASGTLYDDRAARSPSKKGEVILQDIAGNVISMTPNKVGNFWTFAPIASNPRALANHGTSDVLYGSDGKPADPTDARTWQYKAWVKNGNQFIPMVTIAPIGNASDAKSRMSCSMHHGAMGTRGGLWVSRNATLTSYPERGLTFREHIRPILAQKCVPCHIPGNTMTRPVTASDDPSDKVPHTPEEARIMPTTVDYSSGLDLTSYDGYEMGAPPKRGAFDVADGYSRRPEASPLLVKTVLYLESKDSKHPGGKFWTSKDADYQAIRRWIAEGAPE